MAFNVAASLSFKQRKGAKASRPDLTSRSKGALSPLPVTYSIHAGRLTLLHNNTDCIKLCVRYDYDTVKGRYLQSTSECVKIYTCNLP